jgi:hypothetical protein
MTSAPPEDQDLFLGNGDENRCEALGVSKKHMSTYSSRGIPVYAEAECVDTVVVCGENRDASQAVGTLSN